MNKGRVIAIGAAILVPIAILGTLLAVAYSSLPTMEQKVEEEAGLPLLLQPEDNGQGFAQGEILLKEDGVAVLKDFPVGSINQADDYCTSWDAVTSFTGEAKWSVNSRSILSIATRKGDVSIGPYAPAFGDLAWYRFGLLLCDTQETLWYWKATE